MGISSSSDSIGDFHETFGAELERAHHAQRPVPAWVNPAQPDEAVIDRSLRSSLLMFQKIFVQVFWWRGWPAEAVADPGAENGSA